MAYCGVGLISVRVNGRLGYCLVGYCLVGLMSIGLQSMGCCKVRLLSSQVTVWSGYCLFGLLSSQATVFWVNVHWATLCWGCVLGEVFMGLVSGRATVWILLGPTLFLLFIHGLPGGIICNIAIYADDTTLNSKCDLASDLWQQLELAFKLESGLIDTVNRGRKWLVDFSAGKNWTFFMLPV